MNKHRTTETSTATTEPASETDSSATKALMTKE